MIRAIGGQRFVLFKIGDGRPIRIFTRGAQRLRIITGNAAVKSQTGADQSYQRIAADNLTYIHKIPSISESQRKWFIMHFHLGARHASD